MDIVTKYLCVFAVGGILCTIAQILIDKTKLTPARILVLYVVSGVLLTAIGVYDYVVKIGHFGATIPLLGFGYSLCKGVFKAVDEFGFRGIFTGGLADVASGIVTALLLALTAALVSKPKSKKQ
ncbi:MAG: SpoVA/SpoVAEb family sporulation membrane protein [Ruminococcaceae bacterium]|nr:SpoVA/SpoVAEb family sporulation membrane protein [Oscillospiraceae bacterium]